MVPGGRGPASLPSGPTGLSLHSSSASSLHPKNVSSVFHAFDRKLRPCARLLLLIPCPPKPKHSALRRGAVLLSLALKLCGSVVAVTGLALDTTPGVEAKAHRWTVPLGIVGKSVFLSQESSVPSSLGH